MKTKLDIGKRENYNIFYMTPLTFITLTILILQKGMKTEKSNKQ